METLSLIVFGASIVKVYDMWAYSIIFNWRYGDHLHRIFVKKLEKDPKRAAMFYCKFLHDPMRFYNSILGQIHFGMLRRIVKIFYKWPTLVLVSATLLLITESKHAAVLLIVSISFLIFTYMIHEFVAKQKLGEMELIRQDTGLNVDNKISIVKFDKRNYVFQSLSSCIVLVVCVIYGMGALMRGSYLIFPSMFSCSTDVNALSWIMFAALPFMDFGFHEGIKPVGSFGVALVVLSSLCVLYFAAWMPLWASNLYSDKIHSIGVTCNSSNNSIKPNR